MDLVVTPLFGFTEPVSSWLHLAGVLVALYHAPRLLRLANSTIERRSLSVFVFGVVFLLAASGIYHIFGVDTAEREVMQRVDHAAIWLLIAGTFTPTHALLFKGFLRWGILALVWSCAIVGIVIKTLFFSMCPEMVGLCAYLGLGGVGLVSGAAIWWHYGWRATVPLLLGGLVYGVGGVISIFRCPPIIPDLFAHHELFHAAVLVGIAFHWRHVEHILVKYRDRRA